MDATLRAGASVDALPAQVQTPDLPSEPVVTIRPDGATGRLDLRDLWQYRELLYFLTWRDVKVRYKQTALGIAWVLVQPVLMTAIFTLFLGGLARVPSEGRTPYPLFAYVGLLPWTFFSGRFSPARPASSTALSSLRRSTSRASSFRRRPSQRDWWT